MAQLLGPAHTHPENIIYPQEGMDIPIFISAKKLSKGFYFQFEQIFMEKKGDIAGGDG